MAASALGFSKEWFPALALTASLLVRAGMILLKFTHRREELAETTADRKLSLRQAPAPAKFPFIFCLGKQW
jgi:hypothetical protein